MKRLRTQAKILKWAAKDGPTYSTAYCLTKMLGGEITIVLDSDNHAHRHGLGRCNSQACVNDMVIIAAEKRAIATKLLYGWKKLGCAQAMAPLTMSHAAGEAYDAVTDVFQEALAAMRRGNPWKRFKKEWGIGEWMYVKEEMIGRHGFHPHQHPLYQIIPEKVTPAMHTPAGKKAWEVAFQEEHYELWARALAKFGRTASKGHGVRVRMEVSSAEFVATGANYLTKAASELTGAPTKEGKNGSRGVPTLLDDVDDPALSDEARVWARDRWLEWFIGSKRHDRYFFSESHAKETPPGESEVPEPKEPDGEVVMVLGKLSHRMLEKEFMWPHLLDLIENEGVAVATAWLQSFTDPSRWSHKFIRNNGPNAPPWQRYYRPVFGEETG